MALKALMVIFALVALRRVAIRWRKGDALTVELLFWTVVFSGFGFVVFVPQATDRVARWLGVSTGFNLLTFLAIALLFLMVFRLVTRVHALERAITELVRKDALAKPQAVVAKQPEDGPG